MKFKKISKLIVPSWHFIWRVFNCTRILLEYWHLSPSLPTEKQSQCMEEYRLTHCPSPQGLFSWHRSTQPGVACITMVGETSHVTSISSLYFRELRQPMNWWCSIGTACVNPVIQMLCMGLKRLTLSISLTDSTDRLLKRLN